MEYAGYLAGLGAVLMSLVAVPFLFMMLLRSHKIPECFSCGAMKVRQSRTTGSWESFCSTFLIQPYRCEGCQRRFHAFLPFSGASQPKSN